MYPIKTKALYNPDNLASTWNIFTTVYLWNYISWDFDEWSGSHPWVDVIPQVKNDDVFACLDWIIQVAWFTDSNGNYVVIKHPSAPNPDDLSKTTTLYSCHLHLSSLSIKTGDTIKEWDIIGKTGNTGNSTWEHLHFQIDTAEAPFHPYWPFSFKEANEAWLGFFEAVNRWLGIDNARKYTINPLVYLEKVSNIKWTNIPKNDSSNNVIKTQPSPKSKYFKDVYDNIEEIDYLYEKWVTKWYENSTFHPEWNITRAELLIMIYKFSNIDTNWNGANFSDVNKTDWYYPYISSASSKWYINWYSDWTFRPNNPITRAEAIGITLNIIIWKNNISKPLDSDYVDINTSDWFCRYTNYVAQNWLLDSIGNFYPYDNLKRKDLAILLYNLKDKIS